MAGTFPVTAQSPKAIKRWLFFLTTLMKCRFSSLTTAPSTRVRSTSSGKALRSAMGL